MDKGFIWCRSFASNRLTVSANAFLTSSYMRTHASKTYFDIRKLLTRSLLSRTASIDSSPRGEQEAILRPGRTLFAPRRNALGPRPKCLFCQCCEEAAVTNLKERRRRRPSKSGTGRMLVVDRLVGLDRTISSRGSHESDTKVFE